MATRAPAMATGAPNFLGVDLAPELPAAAGAGGLGAIGGGVTVCSACSPPSRAWRIWRPNSSAEPVRSEGDLAMADSMARHMASGTPCGRRSGTGSVLMRAIIGTIDSSVSRRNAGCPRSRVTMVEPSE